MLVLTRKQDETLKLVVKDKPLEVGEVIEIKVVAVRSKQVRIGFNAPKNVLILRPEIRQS